MMATQNRTPLFSDVALFSGHVRSEIDPVMGWYS